MPAYFPSNDGRLSKLSAPGKGLTVIHPQNYVPGTAKNFDAAVLHVRMVVDTTKQSTSGGMFAAPASVKTKAELSNMAQFTEYTLVTPHNGTAVLSLAKHVNSGGQILK